MSAAKTDQPIAPASKQLNPLVFFLEEPHRIYFVANIILYEPKNLSIFGLGSNSIVFVIFGPDSHRRVKPENLQPTGPLHRHEPHITQPSRSAKKAILRQVLTNRGFHLMIAAPIFPPLTEMF
jgi:hypothetical protein